jgi:hypothetical protein
MIPVELAEERTGEKSVEEKLRWLEAILKGQKSD